MVEKLECTKCRFKWKTATGKIPPRCPYCGKPGCITDSSSTAEGFRNVDDLLK